MDKVHLFAVDKVMREEVKEYLLDILKSQIINQAFAGNDVKGYAEAKKVIELSFAQMDIEFGDKSQKEAINEME